MAGAWRCDRCGARFGTDEPVYACIRDGSLLSFLPDLTALRGWRPPPDDPSMWRYTALTPLAGHPAAVARVRKALPLGGTPLRRADRLGAAHGLTDLWLKDETVNPTGTLKDRPSAMVTAAALTRRFGVVATASSGNGATALAAVCAAVGLGCVVFVPRGTPPAKVAQINGYGARTVVVEGDYDEAVRHSVAACERFGWYCRNTGRNPFTAEGKKTVALEIAEELAPDVVVAPVGDGNMLYGLWRGFADAKALGWLGRLPRLVGVQADGADAVFHAWRGGATTVTPRPARTVAESIAVGTPSDGVRVLRVVRATGGAMAVVSDGDLLAGVREVAATTGVLVEPAGAAPAAALPALVASGAVGRDERVVLIASGGGREAPAPPARGLVSPLSATCPPHPGG